MVTQSRATASAASSISFTSASTALHTRDGRDAMLPVVRCIGRAETQSRPGWSQLTFTTWPAPAAPRRGSCNGHQHDCITDTPHLATGEPLSLSRPYSSPPEMRVPTDRGPTLALSPYSAMDTHEKMQRLGCCKQEAVCRQGPLAGAQTVLGKHERSGSWHANQAGADADAQQSRWMCGEEVS